MALYPRERVQVGDLRRPEPVDVVARPVNTMVETRRPTDPSPASRLAESLRAMSPALDSFLQSQQQDHIAEMRRQAEGRINGMTFQEAQEARRAGTLAEVDDGWYRLALDRLYGARLAQNQRNVAVQEYVGSFDREHGDFDQFFQGVYDRGAEEIGDNPEAMAAYMESMAVTRENLMSRHNEVASGIMRQQAADGAVSQMLEIVQQGVAAGQSVDDIYARVRATYPAWGVAFGMTSAEVDAQLVTVAQALADQGQYALVEKLLTDDRGGVGAIAMKAQYAAQAADILDRARTREFEGNQRDLMAEFAPFLAQVGAGQQTDEGIAEFGMRMGAEPSAIIGWQVQNRGAQEAARERVARAQVEYQNEAAVQQRHDLNMAAFEEGTLQTSVVPVTIPQIGKDPVTLSIETQRNATMDRFAEWSAQQAAENNETFEQTLARELPTWAKNGIPNPRWGGILSAGFNAVSAVPLDAGTLGSAAAANVKDGYTLYQTLITSNPQMLYDLISDRELKFYTALEVALRYGDGTGSGDPMAAENFNNAALTANQATRAPSTDRLNSASYDTIATNIQNAANLGFWSENAHNIEYVAREVGDIANTLVSAGLGADEAWQRATERFQAQHQIVNGNAVYIAGQLLRQVGQPDEVISMMEDRINTFATQHGLDADELSLADYSNGQGRWVIVYKASQFTAGDEVGWITLSDLQADKAARQAAQRAQLVTGANAALDANSTAAGRIEATAAVPGVPPSVQAAAEAAAANLRANGDPASAQPAAPSQPPRSVAEQRAIEQAIQYREAANPIRQGVQIVDPPATAPDDPKVSLDRQIADLQRLLNTPGIPESVKDGQRQAIAQLQAIRDRLN